MNSTNLVLDPFYQGCFILIAVF